MTADVEAAFAFRAQSTAGEAVTGTINAGSTIDATRKLGALQLRLIQLDAAPAAPARLKPITGDDFRTFNTQLAYLATAGLPIEKSLRLIAEDMRTGALATTVRQVATDLESGQSLPDAFARHAGQFPPLYSQLVTAGIRTGNLSGMLLSLGRHLDLVKRLRSMLWRAIAYPLMVFLSLLMVVTFLGVFVFPQFKAIFHDFRMDLPLITQAMLDFSDFLLRDWPLLLIVLVTGFIGIPLFWRAIPSPLVRQQVVETLLFPIPVLGSAMKRNLIARWCDCLKLGVEAGLDLPGTITLAGNAVGSPRLMTDGAALVDTLNAGQPLDESRRTGLIPPTVKTVLSLASRSNDLPSSLTTLSSMFQQQAEQKIVMIPGIVTPILIILVALLIGFVVLAMFAPMIALISSVSGPVFHK